MKAKARKPKKIRMKTKKTFAKRSKISGSGELRCNHNYVSHFAAHKSHKQKKHLNKPSMAVHKTDVSRDKQLLQG